MTSMAGPTTTRKLSRGPRGFSVYVPGGSKDGQGQADDRTRKLTKSRDRDWEPQPYVEQPSSYLDYSRSTFSERPPTASPHGQAASSNSYPFPAPGASYGPSSYTYATPSHSSYGLPPQDDMSRPRLRRGDPYEDDAYDDEYMEQDPYTYPAEYAPSRRPALSRSDSTYVDNVSRQPTRRTSEEWDDPAGRSHYTSQYSAPRPQSMRPESGSWGAYASGPRDSGFFQRTTEEPDDTYPPYVDRRSSVSPMSDPGYGAPGSTISTDSDFSMPQTPPQLGLLIPQIGTPGSRSLRWADNLVAPSPIFPVRRKGWFCRRGDQLWTNGGAYRPAKAGDEYPPDLVDYPEFGDGWMNEEGMRIDMHHCFIPKTPRRSALKRRES